MSKPVLVVLSRDQLMASEVPGLFEGQADVRACDSFEELVDLSSRVEPQALLADFRRVGSGGHAENRLLETVARRFPKLRVAMLTADECPEPLARHAAMHNIAMCRGKLDRATLMKAFHPLFPPEPNAEQAEEKVVARQATPAQTSSFLPIYLGEEK